MAERVFTAIFRRDGRWWIGHTPEVRGAFAQERTLREARETLAEAIQDIIAFRRERSALDGGEVIRETLVIEE